MKIAAFIIGSIALLVTAAIIFPISASAAQPDFETVVSAVEHRYSAHAERVPMMGLVSLCAHFASHGGVKGVKIAEFDNLPAAPDSNELQELVSNTLGGSWQRFVTDRSSNGDLNIIYVQPDGAAMRMLIADYEHGELDLVRVEVNGERLARWVDDPQGSAHHHDYGTDSKGTSD